jgi:hypothetical protein
MAQQMSFHLMHIKSVMSAALHHVIAPTECAYE